MRILISNDDGIQAPGIKVLEKIARAISRDVWVVAPETEQSAAGHSLTIRRPLRVRKVSRRRFAVDVERARAELARALVVKPEILYMDKPFSALDALLPPTCLTCEEPVAEQGGLCAACFAKLSFVSAPMCAVCGVPLPPGLQAGSRLPEPIFTPATKAEAGEHDENIDYARLCATIGDARANEVRSTALALYVGAAQHAEARGIIVADTKFEFGLDEDGHLVWIDEALTPDSSRFWPADGWQPGMLPPSFDKQYVRDYLETLDWDKRAPGPRLPPEVIAQTAARYREAEQRLCRV